MPVRLTVAGLRSAAAPGRGSRCCVDCGERGNGWEDGGGLLRRGDCCEGREVPDPGLSSHGVIPKLSGLEKVRKDCGCCP